MVKYETTGTPPTINAGGDASNGGSTSSLVNGRTYFIESSFQVGSSINYVTTIKEFPTSASNINFTSNGTGTHKFTAIGIATDKDIFHLRSHGYVVGDMLRYTYPAAGHFGVNNAGTELKDYYFVERLFGTHNFQVNFTIGELTPKLQEFIGLTAQSSVVAVSFTAVGFTAPLTYSVTSGTLPSGLSLNTSTGAITGTPSVAYSQATVRITVSDASASSDFADVTFQVNPAPNLYSFTSATFTNGGAGARSGPNISQARSAVGQPAWTGSYLNMNTNGYQLWTVPQTATYRVVAAGARGGSHGPVGGSGAIMQGDFALTQGEVITIVCGQTGSQAGEGGWVGRGGGGGTGFARGNTPLLVAGAGGGSAASGGNGENATTGTSASRSNGVQQGGFNGGSSAAGGGGWVGNGGGGTWGTGGLSYTNGGTGGDVASRGDTAFGGFGAGGGGGTHGNSGGGGGGGGYSGGGSQPSENPGHGAASFNAGSNQSNTVGNTGNGYVTVTRL
jgi:hypothetical protein